MSRKKTGTIIIGYDLGNRYSQISYCRLEEGEPETVSAVMGTEQYNIPAVLCKRRGVNQWFYGKEALKYAEMEDGIPVEDLYELAMSGEQVLVDEESFDPVALLTLFIKRSMSILTMEVKLSDIHAVMFTVENLKLRTVEVLSAAADGLGLPAESVYFQSYRESIYQYVVHQPKEMWSQQVAVFDFSDHLQTYMLECSRKTTPMVVFVEKEVFPQLTGLGDQPEGKKKELDGRLREVAEQVCRSRLISTVYLLGDGFKGDWAEESIRFLCAGRRVFQGNNLYSKGACYGAREKKKPTEISTSQVFLGEDKLKANIGMKVWRFGVDSYFAVLDAGVNWHEAQSRYDVILDEGNQVSFLVTSLTGGVVREQVFGLEGLPERGARTTRLRIQVGMVSAEQVRVTVTDMGFGELFPPSNKKWVREFAV